MIPSRAPRYVAILLSFNCRNAWKTSFFLSGYQPGPVVLLQWPPCDWVSRWVGHCLSLLLFLIGTLHFQHDYRVELIPGYLILLQNKPSLYTLEFRVWPTDVLIEFMERHLGYSHLYPILLLYKATPLDAAFFCHNLHLSVYDSPLQQGLYRIWMLAEGRGTHLISKYSISTLVPQMPTLHYRGSQICQLQDHCFNEETRISYAGHVLQAYTYHPCWICQIIPLAEHLSGVSVKEIFHARQINNRQHVSELWHPDHHHIY